jgi:CBS domain containing-hemolysin-like protein
MAWLVIVVALTLALSFACSLLEAIVLSATTAEMEALRKAHPRRGQCFETIRSQMDETISAILTLNTVANGVGSVIAGGLCASLFGSRAMLIVTPIFATVLLLGSEVLPKNVGVAYRRSLLPRIVYPLWWIRRVLSPITWVCNRVVRTFVRTSGHIYRSDEEILLLAERGAKQGTLSKDESRIITNALSLDEVRVSAVMTPRTVVATLRAKMTVAEALAEFPNLRFGRFPVYGRNLDDIVGVVRRRDLHNAKAHAQDSTLVEQLMHEVHFIPETATGADALRLFMKVHQKLLVVVDEFGATCGVLSMEDIMEHLLGFEIFEKDDVAVDMRELARAKQERRRGAGL